MTFPAPRQPGDDAEDRRTWLDAMALFWDHARRISRTNMLFGAHAIKEKLGGALVLRAESIESKRDTPEAEFMTEGLADTTDATFS